MVRSRRTRRSSRFPSALLAEQKVAVHPGPARQDRGGGRPAAGACRQAVPVALRRRGIREGQPPVRPHRPQRDGDLSRQAVRPAADRSLFRGDACRGARDRGRGCVPRFCRGGTGRPARQRLRPPDQAASPASLGHRSARPAVPTPTRFRARRIVVRRSPRRWTIACSSPARRVRPTTIRPRTVPISPASSPPTRRSPRGAASRRARRRDARAATHKDFHRGQRGNRCHKPPTCPTPFIWSAASD